MRNNTNRKIDRQANIVLVPFMGMNTSLKGDILSMRLKAYDCAGDCDAQARSYVDQMSKCGGFYSMHF